MENQDSRMEKRSGTLCLETYSGQDWEKYEDNIACEQFDSPEHRRRVSKHWGKEMIHRRQNYTKSYVQKKENITWICSSLRQFERKEYGRMVEDHRRVYEDRMGRD